MTARHGMRWTWIPATVLALATGLAGAGATAQEGGGALFNDADLLFLQHMILHHEQAVVMSSLVPSRTDGVVADCRTGKVGRRGPAVGAGTIAGRRVRPG